MSLPFGIERMLGQPRYMVTSSSIREYYPLDISSVGVNDLIESITLGPRASFSLDILLRYLKQETELNLETVKVKSSDCPLR